MYRAGTDGAKKAERRPPQCSGKYRHPQDPAENKRVAKPTQQQARHGKRAALQEATSLTEVRKSDRESGFGSDPLGIGESSYEDSLVSTLDGLPHVTPQTADYIA
ncbi:hypothetical protein NDU88_008415 [Pleurodeles waltl]|uniref:Uncharacterized protein n=1 Tax=Pleurodeles waltl TaxID=8319 RepID=A0AAV7QRP9_PLEWA|nr:hypothetical protein NDU88_008415 [Pleurodeles waltl]